MAKPYSKAPTLAAARRSMSYWPRLSPPDIDAIIAERKDAAKRAREAEPLKEHGGDRTKEQGSVTTLNGRGADYLTARIARDRPDILERMKTGEIPSARAGAIEAGIVQKRVSGARVLKFLTFLLF